MYKLIHWICVRVMHAKWEKKRKEAYFIQTKNSWNFLKFIYYSIGSAF